MPKYAVIDLGTNTFHLLIAERDAQGAWATLLRERVFVQLAEDGIDRIGPAAYARGLKTLLAFRQQLQTHGVPPEAILAYGTAALRMAGNAVEFLQEVREQTGIRAKVIDGKREAELIFQGVQQAVPFPNNRVLVMDIGGGSVELILAEGEQVLWQQSFPIGVAVLFRQFHKNDPIAPDEIRAVQQHLDELLTELWTLLDSHPTPTLVGAAGAFDTIDNLLLDPATKPALYGWVSIADFEQLYQRIIQSTLAEREAWAKLAPERRQMIVVGMVLIRHVLQRGAMQEIYTSEYAMKEGMLGELE